MDTNQEILNGLNFDSKSFKQLLDSQSLVDCTLACDGGKISAHKIVLSACSSYLARILRDHPVEHPIIILPELSLSDVETLVHYMYTGELLRTASLNSSSLLRTAATLSINSLNDFLIKGVPNTSLSTAISSQALLPQFNDGNGFSNDEHEDNSINNQISNLMMSALANINNKNSSNKINPINKQNVQLTNDTASKTVNNYINYGASKSEFQFKCPVCQNDFQTVNSFEYHMQRAHLVTSFGCEICHKPFASLRYVLTDHMRRCHGWKAERKLQCQS